MTANDLSAVRERMARILRQPLARLEDGALLSELVADSMLLVNLVIELQEDFKVRLMQDDLKGVKTVGDLLALFARKLAR